MHFIIEFRKIPVICIGFQIAVTVLPCLVIDGDNGSGNTCFLVKFIERMPERFLFRKKIGFVFDDDCSIIILCLSSNDRLNHHDDSQQEREIENHQQQTFRVKYLFR